MSTSRRIVALAALALAACGMQPVGMEKRPSLGTAIGPEELAHWDISIPPSGAGLPAGGGNARRGAQVYQQHCLACHGANGAGKPADALAGGKGTLASKTPLRTVGSYWPYSTTVFDYVRRAMPLNSPLSLTDEEVYAVSAYLLYINGIIDQDVEMNAQTLPQVKMPNRDGFISDWPPRSQR